MHTPSHHPPDADIERLLAQGAPPPMDRSLSGKMERLMKEEFTARTRNRHRRHSAVLACAAILLAVLVCLPLLHMKEEPGDVSIASAVRLVRAVPTGTGPEGNTYRATYETTVSLKTGPNITISVSIPEEKDLIVTNDAI